MDLKELVFGNPAKEHIVNLATVGKPAFTRSRKVVEQFITNYPPPQNDSDEVKRELNDLAAIEISDEERQLCEALDADLHEVFAKMSGFTKEEMKRETDLWVGTLTYIKNHFNRPRPNQLAWYHRIKLFPNINSGSTGSASYPSGHTFQFLILIDYISKHKPALRSKMTEFYKRIRRVREQSGVHYQSDTRGSEILFRMLKDNGIL